MWTVAGCGFCLHFVPGSDSPFLWHGDGPVETEHCHPLALLLREEHDGQNIRPCLYPRCVVYPFSFSQAGVLPYAPPVWHRLLQHPQLVAAEVIPLAVLGRVPQLAPQAFCAVIQPPPDQFLRRGLDPFFQSVLHLGFLFDFIDISHLTPAGRGLGPSLVLLRGQVRGLGGHQFIELRMTGEIVHEGHNGAAALDEAPPKVHIGDVGELVV